MFPSNCKAILKTLDDNIIEYGQATVSLKDKFAEIFRSICPTSENSDRSKNNLYGRSRIYTYNYGKGISIF